MFLLILLPAVFVTLCFLVFVLKFKVEYTKTGFSTLVFIRLANNFTLGRIRPVFFAYLTYLYFCNSDSFFRAVYLDPTNHHIESHRTTRDHTGPHGTTRDHTGPHGTTRDHTGPHGTTRDHTGPHGTTRDHTGPHGTTRDHTGPHGTTRDHTGPHGTTRDHTGPHGTTRDHTGPHGTTKKWITRKLEEN